MPLRLTVPLLWRETATSYTSRLAARNGLTAAAFCRDFGMSFRAVMDGELHSVRAIADLGGVPTDALAAWSPVSLGGRRIALRGHRFPAQGFRHPQLRGCPLCLVSDVAASDLPPEQAMGLRGHWLVPHVGACLKHDHPLVPLYRMTEPVARHDSARHLAGIVPAILGGGMSVQPDDLTEFESWLDARLEHGPGLDWVSGHPLHAASVFCRLLGIALLRLEGLRLDHIGEADRHALYGIGFEVARGGEGAIRAALGKLQNLVETPQDGPKKIYPALYDRLSHDYADDPDYAPFRQLLRDHMASTWSLGPGDELLGEPVQTRRLHSIVTAARETGVDPRRLRKQLVAAGLLDAGCTLPDAWAVFDADSAAPMLCSLAALIPATTFRETIGATRSQFDRLVADGVLRPAIDSSTTTAVWDPREGVAFLARLTRNAVQLRQAQHGWEQISKSAQRLKIGPGPICDAIADGRLRRVGNLEGRTGYNAVYIDHDEVARLFGAEAPPGHSIEVFAKTVGIASPSALRRLILDGRTPATRAINPRTGAEQFFIMPRDADAFDAVYYTLRTMAQAYSLSWQRLGAELARLGVKPFGPDGRDYGRIFLKRDVEHALGPSPGNRREG